MTDLRTAPRSTGLSGGRAKQSTGLARRIARSIAYDLALVPVGLITMLPGREVHQTWQNLAHFQRSPDPIRLRQPGALTSFLHSIVSVILGLLSWFLVLLLLISIVRGPFYGFVEHGPYGPGTWGGPTKAGAWTVHAAVAVPVILLLPLVLRGLGLLHAAFIWRLYGSTVSRMVLPATILLTIGGALFFYSWTQQL
jgi:hypothetical protein